MDKLRNLGSGGLTDGRVAAGRQHFLINGGRDPCLDNKHLLSEVGDSDTSGEIQDLLSFRSVQIQSRSFDDNMILQSSKTIGNMLPTEFSPLGSSPNRNRHLVWCIRVGSESGLSKCLCSRGDSPDLNLGSSGESKAAKR